MVYKNNDLQKNGFITLYRKLAATNEEENDVLSIMYQWYITSFTVEDKVIVSFSGSDIAAFAENSYLSDIPEDLKPSLEEGDSILETTISIGAQIQIAESVLKKLTNADVTIEVPSSNAKKTSYETGWSIRQLLGYAALWQASNYCVEIQDYGKAKLTCTNVNYISVGKDDYASLDVGLQGNIIDCVKVSRDGNTDLVTEKGKTLEDYHVYILTGNLQPTPAGTLSIVCPYVDGTVKNNTTLKSLIGKSYGVEYQCNNVLLDHIFPPFTQVDFEGENKVFYISNASYKLTTMGLCAQISGNTKSLSDFEFVGVMEKNLKNRVALNANYGLAKITTTKGLVFRVQV